MASAHMQRPRHVLLLGSFDLPQYSRGRVLAQSLEAHGVPVEIFLPKGFGRSLRMLGRLLEGNFDALIVNGKPTLLVSWLFRWFHKRKILFDVFLSDFDTLVFDRKLLAPNSLRAKFHWWLDRFCCRRADFNILDTEDHVEYFVDEFSLPRERFGVVPIGADERIFHPAHISGMPLRPPQPFMVEFHGTYIPLQGIEFILRAAKVLEGEQIQFILIGDGQERKRMQQLAAHLGLRNAVFRDAVPAHEVPRYIAAADCCLGIFGITGKAQRVLANKCYEVLAMGKPLITGRTPCTERMIKQGAMLVECGDAKAIAHAILTLKRNDALRRELGARGRKLFTEQFSTVRIGEQLLRYLAPLLSSPLLPSGGTFPSAQQRKRIIIPKPKIPRDFGNGELVHVPRSLAGEAADAQLHEVEQVGTSAGEEPQLAERELVGDGRESEGSGMGIVSEPEGDFVPPVQKFPPRAPQLAELKPEPRPDHKFLQKLDALFAQAKTAQQRKRKPQGPKPAILAKSPFPLPPPLPFSQRPPPPTAAAKPPHAVKRPKGISRQSRKRR